MKRRLVAVLLATALAAGGCATSGSISPNDPEYGRTGAPRAGQPPLPANSGYGRAIMGPDGEAGR